VTDTPVFGQKVQRSRAHGPGEFSNRRWCSISVWTTFAGACSACCMRWGRQQQCS